MTMFAVQILENQPHLPIMSKTIQNKVVSQPSPTWEHWLWLVGNLVASDTSSVMAEGFRAGPLEAYAAAPTESFTTAQNQDLQSRATSTTLAQPSSPSHVMTHSTEQL